MTELVYINLVAAWLLTRGELFATELTLFTLLIVLKVVTICSILAVLIVVERAFRLLFIRATFGVDDELLAQLVQQAHQFLIYLIAAHSCLQSNGDLLLLCGCELSEVQPHLITKCYHSLLCGHITLRGTLGFDSILSLLFLDKPFAISNDFRGADFLGHTTLISIIFSLCELLLVKILILAMHFAHSLNLIEVNNEAFLVGVLLLDALSTEYSQMVRAVKVLHSLVVLFA